MKNSKQAFITIALFSANFLICNSFAFANNVLYTLSIKIGYFTLYSSKFMLLYSWIFAEILCTVLNATLNPILYFCRMSGMRRWILQIVLNKNRNRTEPETSARQRINTVGSSTV
jgi:hypothetical protein